MDKCFLCKSDKKDSLQYGEFLRNKKMGIGVHTYCLYLSSNLTQNGDDSEGILGFLKPDIDKEQARTSHLKCFYCHKRYANIGCCEKRCRRTFHLICGLENGAENQFCKSFKSFCHTHRRKHASKIPAPNTNCLICYDILREPNESFNPIKMILSPCCRNGWYHKLCLQKLANTAGYFFKCPLCNDAHVFRQSLPVRGIFIPNQDAAWELEPNAFAELLERPSECSAIKCVNRQGRNHSSSKNPLIFCTTCGSTAMHRLCLAPSTSRFYCADCTIAREEQNSGRGSPRSPPNMNEGAENDEIDVCNVSDQENIPCLIEDSHTGYRNKIDIDPIDEEIKLAKRSTRRLSSTGSLVEPVLVSRKEDMESNNSSKCNDTLTVSSTTKEYWKPSKSRARRHNVLPTNNNNSSDEEETPKRSSPRSRTLMLLPSSEDNGNDGITTRKCQRSKAKKLSMSSEECLIRKQSARETTQRSVSTEENHIEGNFEVHSKIARKEVKWNTIIECSDEDSDEDVLDWYCGSDQTTKATEISDVNTEESDEDDDPLEIIMKYEKNRCAAQSTQNEINSNNMDVSCIALRTRRKSVTCEQQGAKNAVIARDLVKLTQRRKTVCSQTSVEKEKHHRRKENRFPSRKTSSIHNISEIFDKQCETDEEKFDSVILHEHVQCGNNNKESDNLSAFEISCIANRTRKRKKLNLPTVVEDSSCSTRSTGSSQPTFYDNHRNNRANAKPSGSAYLEVWPKQNVDIAFISSKNKPEHLKIPNRSNLSTQKKSN
uniref:PHD-type domain-containing protein n=1 Tax=Stomoxys calcitrans TaxID=35570 RepID=A0A1I8PEK2_STOCA